MVRSEYLLLFICPEIVNYIYVLKILLKCAIELICEQKNIIKKSKTCINMLLLLKLLFDKLLVIT